MLTSIGFWCWVRGVRGGCGRALGGEAAAGCAEGVEAELVSDGLDEGHGGLWTHSVPGARRRAPLDGKGGLPDLGRGATVLPGRVAATRSWAEGRCACAGGDGAETRFLY